jgi:hypothetical protein
MVRRAFEDSRRAYLDTDGTLTHYRAVPGEPIDHACLENRGNDVGDVAYADNEDTVVDCKDVYDSRTLRVRMPE